MIRQFDERTRANMDVALERACVSLPVGDYATRKTIAERIIACAVQGGTTLSDLSKAALAAAAQTPRRVARR